MASVHFVGVAPDQLDSALRIWGQPDSEHDRATWTVMGDLPAVDVVILGRNAFPVPRKWRKAHDAALMDVPAG